MGKESHAKPIRSLKQAAEIAMRAGIELPEPLRVIARNEDRKQREIIQVWKCSGRSCGKEHEVHIPIKALSCSCGLSARKIWPK